MGLTIQPRVRRRIRIVVDGEAVALDIRQRGVRIRKVLQRRILRQIPRAGRVQDNLERDVSAITSLVRRAGPRSVARKVPRDAAAVVRHQISHESGLLDRDGDLGGQDVGVLLCAGEVVEFLRDLGSVGHDEDAGRGVELRGVEMGFRDDVAEPQRGHVVAQRREARVVERQVGAGAPDHGAEHDGAGEQAGCEVDVVEDGLLVRVGEEDGRVLCVAEDVGAVHLAQGVEDGAADSGRVGNGISDMDVAAWRVAGERRAAVASRVMAKVGAVDGRVSGGVEAVGGRAGAVEVAVGDVDGGVGAEGKDVCGAVVDGDVGVVDVGDGLVGDVDGSVDAEEAGLIEVGGVAFLDHSDVREVDLGAFGDDHDAGVVGVNGQRFVVDGGVVVARVVVRSYDSRGLIQNRLDVVDGLEFVVRNICFEVRIIAWVDD